MAFTDTRFTAVDWDIDFQYPTTGYSEDAASDLYASERVVIAPGATAVVPTNTRLRDGALQSNQAALILSRSGLAANYGVHVLNSPGLIDAGYTGELKVILHNSSDKEYVVYTGYRVAQITFITVDNNRPDDGETRSEDTRGDSGLGSTGIYDEPFSCDDNEDVEDDAVNSPSHYTGSTLFPGLECILVTSRLDFLMGNVVKYLWRAFDKGNLVQDLEKARWYWHEWLASGPVINNRIFNDKVYDVIESRMRHYRNEISLISSIDQSTTGYTVSNHILLQSMAATAIANIVDYASGDDPVSDRVDTYIEVLPNLAAEYERING